MFKRINCHKTTQVPNVVLNTVWIDNISRSKAMREQLTIDINFDTTLEDIQLLRNEMQKFVLDKENCRDFQPDIEVEVTGIGAMNQLELRIEIKHKVRMFLFVLLESVVINLIVTPDACTYKFKTTHAYLQ